ncbi:MAG: hypothetical protein EZS28_009955, partial [Streblomastix strix]
MEDSSEPDLQFLKDPEIVLVESSKEQKKSKQKSRATESIVIDESEQMMVPITVENEKKVENGRRSKTNNKYKDEFDSQTIAFIYGFDSNSSEDGKDDSDFEAYKGKVQVQDHEFNNIDGAHEDSDQEGSDYESQPKKKRKRGSGKTKEGGKKRRRLNEEEEEEEEEERRQAEMKELRKNKQKEMMAAQSDTKQGTQGQMKRTGAV